MLVQVWWSLSYPEGWLVEAQGRGVYQVPHSEGGWRRRTRCNGPSKSSWEVDLPPQTLAWLGITVNMEEEP